MQKTMIYIAVMIPVILIFLFTYTGVFSWDDFNPFTGSEIDHHLTVNFQDGTSTDLPTLDITHQNKVVLSVEYQVDETEYDLSGYTPYFDTPMGEYHLSPSSNGVWTIPIYRLINYSVDDGSYEITLIPDGTIQKEEEPVFLPEPISFTIDIIDERNISIIVG